MHRSPRYAHPSGSTRPQVAVDVLRHTAAFTSLRTGVEQVASLQRDLRALLPEYLANHVNPSSIKDGVLTLFAGQNALAARLRQVAPRLVADLQARGWHVAMLKVRVRPQDAPEPVRIKQARMTPTGADALRELADSLPSSPLQSALARMAARHIKANPTPVDFKSEAQYTAGY
ncbi:MAG: DciA family protein [Burkholderia sp.]